MNLHGEVQIDIFRRNDGEAIISMTVTHLPSGLVETGAGRSELRLRNELVERLRRRLAALEVSE